MGDELTSAEIVEYQAYFRFSPCNEDRADLRSAIVAKTVAETFTGKEHEIKQFMPYWDHENDYQSEEEMKAVLGQISDSWGKK